VLVGAPSDFSQDLGGRTDIQRRGGKTGRATHVERIGRTLGLPRIPKTSGNGGVDSEPTGQSWDGLEEGR